MRWWYLIIMMLSKGNNIVLILCLFIGKHEELWWKWTKESIGRCVLDIQKCQPIYWVWLTIRDDAVHRVLWSNGSNCRDSLVIGSRGSLEIHSVLEEENEALLSFDHYEASSTDRGETVPKRFLIRSWKLLGLSLGMMKNVIWWIMIWKNHKGR